MPATAQIDPFVSALQREGRGFGPAGGGAPPPPPKYVPRELRDGEVDLGRAQNGDAVGLHLGRLLEGRLLIQGNSGAGKSMLLRRLFEQAFGKVQQLLVDPDGEFGTLAEIFDVSVFTAEEMLRVGGRALALHLREHRYSAVLDLSDATSEQRLQFIGEFASGLIEAPSAWWHPVLVHVDEAQTMAPHYDTGDVEPETRRRAIASLADMMGRGRKRGIAGVIATQRLAETSKAVVAKAINIIVGNTIFDVDQERAGASIGFTAGGARALRALAPGEFLCLGPALAGPTRVRFRAGSARSKHKGEAPVVTAPPNMSAAEAKALLLALPPVELEEARPMRGSISVHGKRGRRGIDWLQAHDKIIRDGYAAGTALAEIGAQLAAAGLQVSTSGISTRAHALGLISQKAILGWQPEEDEILRAGYGEEAKIIDIVTRLAESGFSRGRVAVQMRAMTLGITRDRVNYWRPEESAIALAGLNAGKSTREIIADLKAAGFDRGVTGITKFAQKNGISRNSAIPWGDSDITTLTTMYEANKSVAEIMQVMDRSRGAILSMASQLGLRQRKLWEDEEKDVLRKASEDGLRLADVPALLPGRTYATVARMAAQMRLDFSPKRAARLARKSDDGAGAPPAVKRPRGRPRKPPPAPVKQKPTSKKKPQGKKASRK